MESILCSRVLSSSEFGFLFSWKELFFLVRVLLSSWSSLLEMSSMASSLCLSCTESASIVVTLTCRSCSSFDIFCANSLLCY